MRTGHSGRPRQRGRHALLLSSAAVVAALNTGASADTTSNLIDLLVAKGVIQPGEAAALRQQHQAEQAAREQQIRQEVQQSLAATPALEQTVRQQTAVAVREEMDAQKGDFLSPLDKGVGFKAGDVSVQFMGNVNTYTVFESGADEDVTVAGGLIAPSEDGDFSIRNGLLPNALQVRLSTEQKGYDIGVQFGFFPGTSNLDPGFLNANSGGSNFSLGTAGIDARQAFVEFGNDGFGNMKIGRDIGVFGQQAILNDFTLFGVGSSGGNAAPANTSLGRIGLGYIYADFLPQVTYTTPDFGGLTASLALVQPYNSLDFSGLSRTVDGDNVPGIQGNVTYKADMANFETELWGGFTTTAYDDGSDSERGVAGEAGVKLGSGPFGLLAYGYYGEGIGSTAVGFDAIAANGETRESYGGYLQGTYALNDDWTLGASYGVSYLDEADGESAPTLVESNASALVGVRYAFTDWLTFQAEYTYTDVENQAGDSIDANTFTLGSIVFF